MELPSELWLLILGFVNVRDITSVACVSKFFAQLAEDEDLWRCQYLRFDLPTPSVPTYKQACLRRLRRDLSGEWKTCMNSNARFMFDPQSGLLKGIDIPLLSRGNFIDLLDVSEEDCRLVVRSRPEIPFVQLPCLVCDEDRPCTCMFSIRRMRPIVFAMFDKYNFPNLPTTVIARTTEEAATVQNILTSFRGSSWNSTAVLKYVAQQLYPISHKSESSPIIKQQSPEKKKRWCCMML